jgi:signal transduction histidine kinase/ActR/RegA family two-component response regulator
LSPQDQKASDTDKQVLNLDQIEQDLRNSPQLIESMIQSDTVALSILKPIFDNNGIQDFVWVMANKLLRALANGVNVVGKRYSEVFPDAQNNGVMETLRATYNTARRHENEVYHQNRNIKAWLRHVYVRSEDYIILSAEDITLTRKTDQLQAVNARLRSSDEAKTRFFNNASHEFRTPLTLILGPLEDLISGESSKLSPDVLRKLEMIQRNAARLQKLVNTMLDFSRIEAGKFDALFQPTDIAELTEELATNFREVIERGGLKFLFKIDGPVPEVYVNRDMWEKIVLNLLSNAFKFTPKGKIEVSVKAKKKAVQLLVRDTGIGISPKDLSKIFERFVRVKAVGGRTYEGTGIGLSLVKELVEIHGGTVKVKSVEGKGSTFSVTIRKGKDHLPPSQIMELKKDISSSERQTFVDEATSWLPQDTRRALSRKTKNGSRQKFTIIIVDDNADMRDYLVTLLSPIYHVIPLENGKSALNFLQKGFYPDLVISDVMMPEIDGYDLVSFIKNNRDFVHIPIILLSARTGEDAVIEAMDAGADDYLEKPFSSRELLTFVKARISMSQKNSPRRQII